MLHVSTVTDPIPSLRCTGHASAHPPTPDLHSVSRALTLSRRRQLAHSLPRGLNWPIKALSTFRELAHPPWMVGWTTYMKGRRSQKLTHVRACGVHVLQKEGCASGLVRHCGIQRLHGRLVAWSAWSTVLTVTAVCLSVCLYQPTMDGWMEEAHGINTHVVQLYWLQLYCNVKCKLCVVVVVTGPGPSPVPVPVRSRSRYDAPVPVHVPVIEITSTCTGVIWVITWGPQTDFLGDASPMPMVLLVGGAPRSLCTGARHTRAGLPRRSRSHRRRS